MTRPPKPAPGLPTRQQILDFIKESPTPAGKREIARAFGLKGQEKIQLKALLRDMADEGLIDGRRTAYHEMGGLPKVTVLRIVDIEDGHFVLREKLPGISFDDLQAVTGADLKVTGDLADLSVPEL